MARRRSLRAPDARRRAAVKDILITALYNGVIGSVGATSLIVAVALIRAKLGI